MTPDARRGCDTGPVRKRQIGTDDIPSSRKKNKISMPVSRLQKMVQILEKFASKLNKSNLKT